MTSELRLFNILLMYMSWEKSLCISLHSPPISYVYPIRRGQNFDDAFFMGIARGGHRKPLHFSISNLGLFPSKLSTNVKNLGFPQKVSAFEDRAVFLALCHVPSNSALWNMLNTSVTVRCLFSWRVNQPPTRWHHGRKLAPSWSSGQEMKFNLTVSTSWFQHVGFNQQKSRCIGIPTRLVYSQIIFNYQYNPGYP